MLVDFNLTPFNLTQNSLPETYLQIQAAPRIEVAICFFYGAKEFFKNLFLTNAKNTRGAFKTLLNI